MCTCQWKEVDMQMGGNGNEHGKLYLLVHPLNSAGSTPWDRGGGCRSSRPWDKGEARSPKNFLQFDLKIRGSPAPPPPPRAPSLDPQPLKFLQNHIHKIMWSSNGNKPLAWWCHFTTTTGIHFVFFFKFCNPSEVQMTKTLICTKKKIPRGFW